MENARLGLGIDEHHDGDQMSNMEIQDFGLSAVLHEIQPQYRIEITALDPNTVPNIFASRDGEECAIMTMTDLLPRMGKLDPNRRSKLLHAAAPSPRTRTTKPRAERAPTTIPKRTTRRTRRTGKHRRNLRI